MATRATRRCRWLGGLILLILASCNKDDGEVRMESPTFDPPSQGARNPGAAEKQKSQPPSKEYARLHEPFKTALLLEPPKGERRPPDVTCTGQNVARLFEAIAGRDGEGGLWDKIRFLDAKDRPLKYSAVLKTALGEVHIDLFPDAAPNHVRSFVALAQLRYFDGLPIYRSVRSEADGETIAYVESGCPLGRGEVGYGSIGYWLKPEIHQKLTHEAGVLGAVHREELETAACRFYLTTQPMPQFDGSFTLFGKVTRGLEILRTINARPVDEVTSMLQEPVLIQRVEIRVTEEPRP